MKESVEGKNMTATEVNERMDKPSGVMSNKLSDSMVKHVRGSFDQGLRDAMEETKTRIKFYNDGSPFSEVESGCATRDIDKTATLEVSRHYDFLIEIDWAPGQLI